jgi:hypothetical protein
VNLVADGLPILNLGTSNPLDRLLDDDNHSHSVAGHLDDLTSVITSGDPISALVGNILPDAFTATSHGGGAHTDLPVVSAISDPAHVSIVVEATAIIPGHSIDFPTAAPPEADVLFHGNSYTDYHVALQSAGPSFGSGGIAPTLASMSGMPDATLLTHVDTPVANAAPSTSTGATVQHPDVLLTHISTTLDDLSLRGHMH